MNQSIFNSVKCFKKSVCKITCQNTIILVSEPYQTSEDEMVAGSGFFVHPRYLYMPEKIEDERVWYCVTNTHVIEGASSRRVSIEFPYLGTTSFFGETVVVNQHLDFAIIRFRLRWNESVEQQLGVSFYDIFDSIPLLKPNAKVLNTAKSAFKEVCTIGFPLDSDDNHISVGKISGRAEHYLQLNQSISSGNSGGPLLSERGEVVGIIAANFGEAAEGLSLAIPWSSVSTLLSQYKEEDDFILYPPTLGIASQRLVHAYANCVLKDSSIKGALVKDVFEKSPLHKKLKKGDIVVKIGDARESFEVDSHGLVSTIWQTDKVPFHSLQFLVLLDRQTCFIEYYRKGKLKRIDFELSTTQDVGLVDTVMAAIQEVDSCLMAGLVFTDLTANHLEEMEGGDADPSIVGFLSKSYMAKRAVILSEMKQPCSVLQQGYDTSLKRMTIIKSIGKTDVASVAELQTAFERVIKKYAEDPTNEKKRFVMMHTHDDTFIIDLQLAFQLEPLLKSTPGYPVELSLLEPHLITYASALSKYPRPRSQSLDAPRKRQRRR